MDGKTIKGKNILSASPKMDRDYCLCNYDFTRPDKFSLEQIRTVAIMHETFARLATLTISSQLKQQAHMHVAAVDQMTYEEFVRSLPNPAAIAILNMSPLRGSAVLATDPQIASAMNDRLFGGQGEVNEDNRELTEIGISMMEMVTNKFMENLKHAWCKVIDLNPTLGQIETNPQFAQIVPPTQMIILVLFGKISAKSILTI